MDRFHKAARDGMLEVLKEATKKEINQKDDKTGMTPVLWAAFEGRFDALRLLVGRGGNPDESDHFGNTSLHLASAKGHWPVVDFLVKFGANIFALDIDNHNPQQLAAINNREEILRYLDSAAAHLESTDKKKANAFKEKAKKHSEKRIKEFLKRQQKQEAFQQEGEKSGMLKTKLKFWSGSTGNLSKSKDSVPVHKEFSALVGSGNTIVQRSAAQRKIHALKQSRQANVNANGSEFPRRDSEVQYVGTFQNASNDKRTKIADVFAYDSNNDSVGRFGTLSRCLSQPDFLASGAIGSDLAEDIKNQRPSGLFDRPGLGSLSIPRSVTSQMSSDQMSEHSSSETSATQTLKMKQNLKTRQQLVISDSESDANDSSSDENDNQPLKRFLAAYSLEEHFDLLIQHQIDLDTLILLTEEDLKILNLPLGHFRRLFVAIQERKNCLTNPGAMLDSRL